MARAIWTLLALFGAVSLLAGRWSVAFVSFGTLAVSLAPLFVARWADIKVPPSFIAAIVAFVGGTLFLGEVFDFYEAFWWWDVVMHGSSAVGFGLIGFVLIFMMFQGDAYAAPPIAMAFFAFCFAIAIGAFWEVFEFGMDQLFGLNMQKSGLMDTMGDLIVDAAGALIGASAGWAYLKYQNRRRGLAAVIEEFVRNNPRLFPRRLRNRFKD
ncbi:hypothetical protein [Thalassobius sp. Cn5-15]|uniref:hypothetical protein n=1 Tax=Thalassobius sp. Cn5-15 TaxID=2917763 RepID=UPI001EF1FF6B|nr:hypothetical protein [Thalassobius sp. Cn5-15]MCG7492319.1 hypothetical protein [Thalassobius sp. Cn5-15]